LTLPTCFYRKGSLSKSKWKTEESSIKHTSLTIMINEKMVEVIILWMLLMVELYFLLTALNPLLY